MLLALPFCLLNFIVSFVEMLQLSGRGRSPRKCFMGKSIRGGIWLVSPVFPYWYVFGLLKRFRNEHAVAIVTISYRRCLRV